MKRKLLPAIFCMVIILLVLNVWCADVYRLRQAGLRVLDKYSTESDFQPLIDWSKYTITKLTHSHQYTSKKEIQRLFDNWHMVEYALSGQTIKVSSLSELELAVATALPGNIIVLSPGIYMLSKKALKLKHWNEKNVDMLPIIVMPAQKSHTTIKITSTVGFEVLSSNIVIKNFVFEGHCQQDKDCEHAIHLKGDSDYITIAGNDFVNFNAAIKSNGEREKHTKLFPDDVSVIENRFYNSWPRNTRSPVTPIDIVGGKNWLISRNFVADFSKQVEDTEVYTYGAFLKGNGRSGEISENFVACSWNIEHQSALDIRVGLSLGGGGTGYEFCESNNCDLEHEGGKITNNVIVNCSNGVGIYLNKAKGTLVQGNVITASAGIDVDSSMFLSLINNRIDGNVKMNKNSSYKFNSNNIFRRDVDDNLESKND